MADEGSQNDDALTKEGYERIRAAHEERVRADLAKESEKERQKRLWAEENARRASQLG